MAWGLLAQALHKFFYLKHLPIATGSLAYIFAAICLVPLVSTPIVETDAELQTHLLENSPQDADL